jgi:hypothetical protein
LTIIAVDDELRGPKLADLGGFSSFVCVFLLWVYFIFASDGDMTELAMGKNDGEKIRENQRIRESEKIREMKRR